MQQLSAGLEQQHAHAASLTLNAQKVPFASADLRSSAVASTVSLRKWQEGHDAVYDTQARVKFWTTQQVWGAGSALSKQKLRLLLQAAPPTANTSKDVLLCRFTCDFLEDLAGFCHSWQARCCLPAQLHSTPWNCSCLSIRAARRFYNGQHCV